MRFNLQFIDVDGAEVATAEASVTNTASKSRFEVLRVFCRVVVEVFGPKWWPGRYEKECDIRTVLEYKGALSFIVRVDVAITEQDYTGWRVAGNAAMFFRSGDEN